MKNHDGEKFCYSALEMAPARSPILTEPIQTAPKHDMEWLFRAWPYTEEEPPAPNSTGDKDAGLRKPCSSYNYNV